MNKLSKFLVMNARPLALLVFATCIGYLFGAPITGAVVGLAILAAVTALF